LLKQRIKDRLLLFRRTAIHPTQPCGSSPKRVLIDATLPSSGILDDRWRHRPVPGSERGDVQVAMTLS